MVGAPPDNAIEAASAAAIHAIDEKRSGRWFRVCLRLAMRLYDGLLQGLQAWGRQPRPLPPDGCDILLTGTFFSDNWVRSHILPLAASARCRRLRMVATSRVPAIPKVEGVYPPGWLIRTTGKVPARLLYFIWVALRTRPHIVGGFHLLINGLVTALLARVVGAYSMYFCVGGPVELLDGGVHGENRIFARLGEPDPVVEHKLLNAVGASDLVITMGTRAIEFFKSRGLSTRFEVVSGGIDATRFYPARQATEFDIVLTCRLVPIKRVDLFLHTVALLVKDLPQLRALIVGDGPLRGPMEALARDFGITDHVTFAGQQADVEVWLRRSRVFVLTSDSEGLSLSLMEAMMSGLPAVVSRVGDLGDLVTDGVNGYLVAERSAAAFAGPIRYLLGNPAELDRFAAAAAAAGAANRPDDVTERWNRILGGLDSPAARARSA